MNTTSNKIKILLIDNDEMMRIFFRDIFWIHGRSDAYDVETALSIEEAEKKITDENTKPDIIFIDINMSTPYGKNSSDDQTQKCLSFVEKIRKNKDLASIKIVIFSSQKEELIKEAFSKLGVKEYLIKGELMPKEIIAFTDKIHGSNN